MARLPLLLLLLLLLLALAASSAAAALTDAGGLRFSSRAALCAVHCRASHRASECSASNCGRRLSQQLAAAELQQIDFLKCNGVAQSSAALSLSLATDRAVADVFRDFHGAFFAAFDALLASDSATFDACQLQFLQDKLLPTAERADAVPEGRRPMLVQLARDQDERACIQAIKTLWSDVDEALTPLLSRSGNERGAAFTVLLLHIDNQMASYIGVLACVRAITELPKVLKLLPFARSAAQLGVTMKSTDEIPAMEIRLVDGSDTAAVLERLQSTFAAQFGILNMFEAPNSTLSSSSLYTKPLMELITWSHAVALAVSDSSVEWIDVRGSISQNAIADPRYRTRERRLDEYVHSLIGIDAARAAGIRGNDVIVGITDSGLYLSHDQFDQDSHNVFDSANTSARKVVYYNAWADDTDQSDSGTCGHGTHVAGILAGSSYSGNYPSLGIADRSRIAFMDIGTQRASCAGQSGCAVQLATPARASDLVESQMNVGAKIFSFSWGTPGSDYSSQARDLDEFIYQNPEVLVVVAAGNSGETAESGTISSPSGAKNVISVGASLNSADSFSDVSCPSVFNEYSVASFSSSGPTTDGRLKPDVVAPGMRVISSQSGMPGSTAKTAATCSLQGTSQATPVVAGMAVLLYEWLRDGWWKNGVKDSEFAMTTVPAALLKALIIHSGEPLRRRLSELGTVVSCGQIEKEATPLTTFPNIYQGYGKPNLNNIVDLSTSDGNGTTSLYFLPNSTAGSEPLVAHNQQVVISFTVSKDVDLRTTLVWTDPPGSVRSTTQLQHDLDLSVRIRNGSTNFYPVTADNSTNRDAVNNVEVVLVTYDELLTAAANDGIDVGASGELVVEAVIFGRSVLLADAQAFAFVASSSAIGSASGYADSAGTSSGSSSSIWHPWMIAAVGGGALVLLIVIAACVRWRVSRKYKRQRERASANTSRPAPGFNTFTTPQASDKCPFCRFHTADAVIMVNHVEAMHPGTAQPVPSDPSHVVPELQTEEPEQQCPLCAFRSRDAVILVNHLEHIHGE